MAQHYDFCDDYMTIVAGTSNTIARAYIEASEHVEDNDDAGTKYLKKFVTSIEKLAKSSKVNDSRITSSKGNLKSFSDYENIEYMLNFLSKYVKESIVSDLKKIHSEIISCASEYETGYDKKVRLIELEYESGVYLLITGLVYTMSNCIEFSQQNGGFNIIKKAIDKKDLLVKMISKFAKQLSDKNHKEYLKKLAQVSTEVKRDSGKPVAESYEGEYTIESVVGETLDLIDGLLNNISRIGTGAKNIYRTVKKSMFGIIPMVRGIIYLHYKKKADHIANLEQQCEFIKLNIEQLNRRTDLSPEEKERLTKKQQAYANAYAKKAAKIRAELNAQCRDAAASLEKDRADIKDAPNSKDDDMVLESSNLFVTDPHTHMNDEYGVLDEDPDFIDTKPNDDYEEPRLSDADIDMSESDPDDDDDDDESDAEDMFNDSIKLAKSRKVDDDKILKSKSDIDNYFMRR